MPQQRLCCAYRSTHVSKRGRQAFEAQKEGVMYYTMGAGGGSGEPIHRNASGADPVDENPVDVIVRGHAGDGGTLG